MLSTSGTYALLLNCRQEKPLQIGKLGELDAKPGYFVYLGSAFGPGGLSARLSHHRRPIARPRWHIDYLRTATVLTEIWFTWDPSPREHHWAGLIAALKDASIPLPGFGSTDCKCPSHLYFFEKPPSIQSFRRRAYFWIPSHWKVLHCSCRSLDARVGSPAATTPEKIPLCLQLRDRQE